MEEHLVQFERKGILHGTLTTPANRLDQNPAVLILPGSGPLDRDGNGKVNFNLYNKLAEVFNCEGLITLRYDKRGTGESEGSFLEAGMSDLIQDAKAALHYLKTRDDVDENNVVIAGHSEGAMLATAIAAFENLAGVILISGAAESLKQALTYQRQLISKELQEKKGLSGSLLRLFKIDQKVSKQGEQFDQKMLNTDKDIVRHQLIRMPAKWFREHFEYDLFSDLKLIKCPILAVAGSKDVQATPERVYQVADYVDNSQVTAHIIPDMNHMLRHQPEPRSSLKLKKIYKGTGDKQLSPKLVEALKEWTARNV